MNISSIKSIMKSPIIATALALFAMLFGSGNIALPLGLGRDVGSMAMYAIVGFFLTAVLVPVLGIIAMALYNGDYQEFAQRAGKIPGKLIIALCLIVMGPFCIIPRCIALSYLAIQWIFPQLSLLHFTLFSSLTLACLTMHKNSVVSILSRYLGPIKLLLLSAVIAKSLFVTAVPAPCLLTGWSTFIRGIFEGYGTLDLLGVIFFSGFLLQNIQRDSAGNVRTHKELLKLLIKAGSLGALLLGLLYSGFILVAALQSGAHQCITAEEGQLLSVLATIILGAGGGILASITLALACLSTAVALTTIFAEYLSTELKPYGLTYSQALIVTLAVTTFFANYGFAGIKAMLVPLLVILYPALIVLTCTNIIYKMWRIDLGKAPFYLTLFIAATIHIKLFS